MSEGEGRYVFSVPSQARAILDVKFECAWENEMVLFQGEVPLFKLNRLTNPNGGRFIINPQPQATNYCIFAQHKHGDNSSPNLSSLPWHKSFVKVLTVVEKVTVIGFDDSSVNQDYNDIMVTILIE